MLTAAFALFVGLSLIIFLSNKKETVEQFVPVRIDDEEQLYRRRRYDDQGV